MKVLVPLYFVLEVYSTPLGPDLDLQEAVTWAEDALDSVEQELAGLLLDARLSAPGSDPGLRFSSVGVHRAGAISLSDLLEPGYSYDQVEPLEGLSNG